MYPVPTSLLTFLSAILVFSQTITPSSANVLLGCFKPKPPKTPLKPLEYVIDWRKKGVVSTPVDQKMCGACWAFAVAGVIEAQHAIKTGKFIPLSAQQIVDCAKDANGCKGLAYPSVAFSFVKENGGLASAADYPYRGKKGACNRSGKIVPFHIRGSVDVKKGTLAHLELLVRASPVFARLDSTSTDLLKYKRGIHRCTKYKAGDHAVLVVGYGKDPNTNTDFWVVKNSWGPKWGEQGFFRLAKNEDSVASCGITAEPTYIQF